MKEFFKKLWKGMFCTLWGVLGTLQLFFVLGLVGGSAKASPFLVGALWFGITVFWMIGMSNDWGKNPDQKVVGK